MSEQNMIEPMTEKKLSNSEENLSSEDYIVIDKKGFYKEDSKNEKIMENKKLTDDKQIKERKRYFLKLEKQRNVPTSETGNPIWFLFISCVSLIIIVYLIGCNLEAVQKLNVKLDKVESDLAFLMKNADSYQRERSTYDKLQRFNQMIKYMKDIESVWPAIQNHVSSLSGIMKNSINPNMVIKGFQIDDE